MLDHMLEILEGCSNLNKSEDLISHVNEILHEDSTSTLEIICNSDSIKLWQIVATISEPGLVKDFQVNEDRDYDDKDFPLVAQSAVRSFKCLTKLLDRLILKDTVELPYCLLISLLTLCATHHQEFPWSSYESVSCSTDFIQKLVQFTRFKDVKSLLVHSSSSEFGALFKSFIVSLRDKLTKKTWTRNPSTCWIFKWILVNVKHLHLSDHLVHVLPPSLMFIDHHAIRHKALGIECLNLIIDNVPPSELKMYGRADVVYDALFHLTYLRELDVVRVLYPCILNFLSGQEKNRTKVDQPRKWGRYDDVYHQLLWNMELEDNIPVRREFSSNICLFIEALGITITKHMKRTKRVLLDYLSVFESNEEISRLNALRALNILIRKAWPRMEFHCEDILRGVLILVYDVETAAATSDPEVKEDLLTASRKCLLLLRSSCPETFHDLTSKTLQDLDEELPSVHFLRSVCEAN